MAKIARKGFLVLGKQLFPWSHFQPYERLLVFKPVATVRGVNLYAKQRVDGRDRNQLERLCRYITRPPIAQERLERRADGRFELAFKSGWKDGTRALVLEGEGLIARLVAAISPQRFHLVRYFGVLSSHSSLRAEVVPIPPADPTAHKPPQRQVINCSYRRRTLRPSDASAAADCCGRVFRADVHTCPRCAGPMRWLEAATSADPISRPLVDHGLAPRPTPKVGARAGPQQLMFGFVLGAERQKVGALTAGVA